MQNKTYIFAHANIFWSLRDYKGVSRLQVAVTIEIATANKATTRHARRCCNGQWSFSNILTFGCVRALWRKKNRWKFRSIRKALEVPYLKAASQISNWQDLAFFNAISNNFLIVLKMKSRRSEDTLDSLHKHLIFEYLSHVKRERWEVVIVHLPNCWSNALSGFYLFL